MHTILAALAIGGGASLVVVAAVLRGHDRLATIAAHVTKTHIAHGACQGETRMKLNAPV